MKAVVVLPWLDRDLMLYCEGCMKKDKRWDWILVDNSEINIGVASSWNVGANRVLKTKADWLILLSTTVRFGTAGGTDFLDGLEQHGGADLVSGRDMGWHLHAISRNAIERVGLFDEVFNPAYYEDNDWLYRYKLEYGVNALDNQKWIDVDHVSLGDAHSLRFNHVAIDIGIQRQKYRKKWGADPGEELYTTPYHDVFAV